jgi:hypothetical protein
VTVQGSFLYHPSWRHAWGCRPVNGGAGIFCRFRQNAPRGCHMTETAAATWEAPSRSRLLPGSPGLPHMARGALDQQGCQRRQLNDEAPPDSVSQHVEREGAIPGLGAETEQS